MTYVPVPVLFDREHSAAARWCQKLALFNIPFLGIIVGSHKAGLVDTPATLWLLAIAVGLLVAAVLLGIKGFLDLWYRGDKGGMRILRGLTVAGLLLVPFAYFAIRAAQLPPLYDISTDLDTPPEFDNAIDDRLETMNPISEFTPTKRDLQLTTYPRVTARRYALGIDRVNKAVLEIVKDHDWTLLTSDGFGPDAATDADVRGTGDGVGIDKQGHPRSIPTPRFRPAEGERQAEISPVVVSPVDRAIVDVEDVQNASDERYVEAVATTLLFGFESDVVIRIIEEENGTVVDMRSASRWGPHDLGSNAARIIMFMSELDLALQGAS